MAWYNTYRPQQFSDVIGQELVKTILGKTLESGQVRHAYLFSGSRGVGKTTLARIFANNLNNISENPAAVVDIVELDAASNTGIDDIRMLRESAQVAPIAGQYKVFIIDEVHMLSKAAMNALLKILEEPPQYLIFLLATTNPEKLLPTVLSRVTKLPLQPHTTAGIIKQLEIIGESEKLVTEKEALELIAERSAGSQRDAINTLETLAGYGLSPLTADTVRSLLGLVPEDLLVGIGDSLYSRDYSQLSQLSQSLDQHNIDAYSFLDQALNYYLKQALIHSQPVDVLIQALARTLDLQYPISTNFQAVSLVTTYFKSQISGDSFVVAKQEKKTKKHAVTTSTPAPVITETKLEVVEEVVIDPTEGDKPVVDSVSSEEVSDSVVDNTLLEGLFDRGDKPNSLKMIPDLNAIIDSSGAVVLQTAVGMFLPTLKSAPVATWLQSVLGAGIVIKTEQVNSEKIPKKEKPVEKKSIQQSENQEEVGVFYTVYGDLPEGNTEGLKSSTTVIPTPETRVNDKSFDEHAEELFEFE